MKEYLETERMRFADLRNIAIKLGIKDNKTTIGIWAQLNGYIRKTSTDKNRKVYIYYIKNL